MAEPLDLRDVRPEFLVPEARPYLMAVLEVMSGRVRNANAYRERGCGSVSLLDALVSLHIYVFAVTGHAGTRQSDIIGSIPAPRRTLRDGLKRLELCGAIVRDQNGYYYPSKLTGLVQNENFDADFRAVARMTETFAALRQAIGR